VVVAAAFVALFTVFGVAFSFGAFFGPIAAEFRTGRAAASGVFSLTSLLYFTLGAASGPAADRLGPGRCCWPAPPLSASGWQPPPSQTGSGSPT
jgi:hypothetical protein